MPQTLVLGNTKFLKKRQTKPVQAKKPTPSPKNTKPNTSSLTMTPFGGGMINRIANIRPGCGSCGGAR